MRIKFEFAGRVCWKIMQGKEREAWISSQWSEAFLHCSYPGANVTKPPTVKLSAQSSAVMLVSAVLNWARLIIQIRLIHLQSVNVGWLNGVSASNKKMQKRKAQFATARLAALSHPGSLSCWLSNQGAMPKTTVFKNNKKILILYTVMTAIYKTARSSYEKCL